MDEGSPGEPAGLGWDPEDEVRAYAGDSAAMARLGRHLRYDDPRLAMEWLTKAAERGDVISMAWLGWMYWTRDRRVSRRWYRRAAEAGNRYAMYCLAVLLDPCFVGAIWNGPRQRESQRWLEKAASLGEPEAELRLAYSQLVGHASQLGGDDEAVANARRSVEHCAATGNTIAVSLMEKIRRIERNVGWFRPNYPGWLRMFHALDPVVGMYIVIRHAADWYWKSPKFRRHSLRRSIA